MFPTPRKLSCNYFVSFVFFVVYDKKKEFFCTSQKRSFSIRYDKNDYIECPENLNNGKRVKK
jgi:hypothetical protein